MSVTRNVALSLDLSLTDSVVLKLPVPLLTLCGRTGYFEFLSFRLYFQPILNVTFCFDYSIRRLFIAQLSYYSAILSRLIDSSFTSGQFFYH